MSNDIVFLETLKWKKVKGRLSRDGRTVLKSKCDKAQKQKKTNKKSEIMLMKRAKAYSSSCSQIILVYLHPSRRNSLFCSRISQKITKSKNSYFRLKGQSRSQMLAFLRRSSPVTVMMGSMSVPICNHFHARQANSR